MTTYLVTCLSLKHPSGRMRFQDQDHAQLAVQVRVNANGASSMALQAFDEALARCTSFLADVLRLRNTM